MTPLIVDVPVDATPVVQLCPLCGEVLDPDCDHVLCARCEEDEKRKQLDDLAEREQARRPF